MKPLEPKAERRWVRARLLLALLAIIVVGAAFALPEWQQANLAIRLSLVALIVSQLIPDLISQVWPSGLQPKVLQRVEAACHGWRNYYVAILGGDRVASGEKNTWEDLQSQPVVEDTREEFERFAPLFKNALPNTVAKLDGLMAAHSDQLPTSLRKKILDSTTQLEAEASAMTRGYVIFVAFKIDGTITFRINAVLKLLAGLCREAERLRGQLE